MIKEKLETEKVEQDEKEKFTPDLWRQRRNFTVDYILYYCFNENFTILNDYYGTKKEIKMQGLTLKQNAPLTGSTDSSKKFKLLEPISSVCDLGVGQASLLSLFANSDMIPFLAGVDIVPGSLNKAHNVLLPTSHDVCSRETVISLYLQSLHEFNPDLVGYECFAMLEVIEHLLSNELMEFPLVLFGKYRPRLVIISTPNKEFNKLFRDYDPENEKMRHWDHKFEWTRSEFQDWAKYVAAEFDYTVEFSGVGVLDGAAYDENIGYCTQIGIFERKKSVEQVLSKSPNNKHLYRQIIYSPTLNITEKNIKSKSLHCEFYNYLVTIGKQTHKMKLLDLWSRPSFQSMCCESMDIMVEMLHNCTCADKCFFHITKTVSETNKIEWMVEWIVEVPEIVTFVSDDDQKNSIQDDAESDWGNPCEIIDGYW